MVMTIAPVSGANLAVLTTFVRRVEVVTGVDGDGGGREASRGLGAAGLAGVISRPCRRGSSSLLTVKQMDVVIDVASLY